ncbi:PilW family protein [Shewanella psychrotolerans]|uniref:PilW family protein n=1 Tax=Shewanella psychrotolerans TaxID=2864206 RepID=UPI001C65D16F|nr:PilW family protein [Shewanella psychrotolerans]QYK00599.1 PilW family protein [Shewanella psychrotolerans]
MKNITKNLKLYQTGMSLVELMVAMVIGLFLTAGVFTMFSMSSSNVTTTSQFNQLQENGRIALAIMERDISQLGFFGDYTGTDIDPTNPNVMSAAVPNDCFGGGANNATLPNTSGLQFRRVWGYEAGGSGVGINCLTGVRANTDVIQLKRLLGPGAPLPLNTSRHYVATASNEAIFFTGGQSLPVLENSRIWEYLHHIYFIKNDGEVPVLRRRTLTVTNGMNNEEQLVEGIENIRVLYGFDDDADGVVDIYRSVSNVSNSMWESALMSPNTNAISLTLPRLVAVKIYVLVRSLQEDVTYTNDVEYQLGDKTIVAPKDHYRRKVMSTSVILENPMLIGS